MESRKSSEVKKQITLLFIWMSVAICFYLFSGSLLLKHPPFGDEGNYLMISISLFRDHDVNLLNNFQNKDYLEFTNRALEPHIAKINSNHLYSIHFLGLPLLAMIPYALGGRLLVFFSLNLLASASCWMTFMAVHRLTSSLLASLCAVVCMGCSIPFCILSGMLYPESAGIFCISAILWLSTRKEALSRDTGLIAIICFLPWLHVKFAIVSVVFYIVWSIDAKDRKRWFLSTLPPAIIAAAGFFYYQQYIYGDPMYIFGLRSGGLGSPLIGLLGLFLDREAGIFTLSPVFILALPGIFRIRSTEKVIWNVHIAFFFSVMLSASWIDWHGSLPGRYVSPFIPVLVLDIALLLSRSASIVRWLLFALSLGLTLMNTILLALQGPYTVLLVTDGINRVWERHLPSLQFFFPSLLNPVSATQYQISGWLIILTAISFISFTVQHDRNFKHRRIMLFAGLLFSCLGVFSIFYGFQGETAEIRRFDSIPLSDQALVLRSPENEAVFNERLPTLIWDAVRGADRYYWQVTFPSGDKFGTFIMKKTQFVFPDSALPLFEPGTYFCQVTPYKKSQAGIPSRVIKFHLKKTGALKQ